MRIGDPEAPIKVGVAQTRPRVGESQANTKDAVRLVERAVADGLDLFVLPELATSGYAFETRAEAFQLAEPVPDGPISRKYLQAIAGSKLFLVAGICERDKTRLYNTAAVFGPDGYVGKYRKLHLWNRERLFFEPGDLGLPIFHLPFGRLGVMICYDAWFPETVRILKLQGADIVCDPSDWDIDPARVQDDVRVYVHLAQAHMNNLFIACADRVGEERGLSFAGRSCIVGPAGFIAGPASAVEPDVLVAEINLADARRHHWNEIADPLADRRIDIYSPDLGYKKRGLLASAGGDSKDERV